MLKIPSATVRWFSQTDTSIYRGFLPWFSHDFPWFFPMIFHVFFCLMTRVLLWSCWFQEIKAIEHKAAKSFNNMFKAMGDKQVPGLERAMVGWWCGMDETGKKLGWNWDETDVDELLGSFYWLPSLGDFEVTTLCLRWPQQPTIQFTPRCIANTRNKNMNHSEIRQIVAYPCSYPDQPLLVMGSEAILCRWSPFVFCESTRRRMARERRGAGSSLVSMETQY